MNILVNATNLVIGGGLQVTDALCRNLNTLDCEHRFFVVLSKELNNTREAIKDYLNVEVYTYNIQNSIKTLVFGRDDFLDNLTKEKNIDFVLTVFGPSRWNPKVKHLSGFAMAQLIMKDSVFFSVCSLKDKLKWKYFHPLSRKVFFKRSTNLFWSENSYISNQVERIFKGSKCYTVSNYYNSIYDNPEQWKEKALPKFNGVTLLCISSYYPFKNLEFSIKISKYLKEKYKDFGFRFVFTCQREEFAYLDEDVKDNILFIGRVGIEECPSLYSQCDFVFMPSLMECFTAVYPESFKMKKPLLTSDLPFAKGLCGEAAEYFSPVDEKDAAEKIYSLYNDKERQKDLTDKGEQQLKTYDNNTERLRKLVKIMEENLNR